MSRKSNQPKTFRQILSADYHIPGVRPPFYLPVFAISVAGAFWLTPVAWSNDVFWAEIFLIFVAISTTSAFIGRVIRRATRH